jgi:hypothetical protein
MLSIRAGVKRAGPRRRNTPRGRRRVARRRQGRGPVRALPARHHRARPRPFPNQGRAPRATRRSLAGAPSAIRMALPPSAARPRVRRLGERPSLRKQLAKEVAVAGLDRLDLARREWPGQLARHRSCEEATTHANPAVDPPAVDRQACLGQRALPGEHVGVDRVDQRSVEVEDQRWHRLEPTRVRESSMRKRRAGRPAAMLHG